ncbi:MAG: Peptidase T [Promethearchaeota archaeon]|nr:MAG: Peptidase T [Candidatus Lokiarchaeota archaeon]
MELTSQIKEYILEGVVKRFLKYVQIDSQSDDNSNSFPSTQEQIQFGKVLVEELKLLGLQNIIHDKYGYIYAQLRASKGYESSQEIGLIAHLDTSPSVNGKDVKPKIHSNYQGGVINFEKNKNLVLSLEDSPALNDYMGEDIITSKGDTLLGADDKAGIAEIMTLCDVLSTFTQLVHGPIVICFFPDEELGKGTEKIDISKLPRICYTVDGSRIGELEFECFDAWKVNIIFKGLNVHPGYAKGLMINSIHIAAQFISDLPEFETPRNTEGREGFYHLISLKGTPEKSKATLLLRDFEEEKNSERFKYLEILKTLYERKYEGLKIEIDVEHQYENMKKYLESDSKVIKIAKEAIQKAGLDPIIHSIRGGTDGAHLSKKGIPTPNLFTGGMLFHSKKEYIPKIALQKATEVLLYLSLLWKKHKKMKEK